MTKTARTRRFLMAATALVATAPAFAQTPMADGWSERVWSSARTGDETGFLELMSAVPDGDAGELESIFSTADSLRDGFSKREDRRAERRAELEEELDEALADGFTDLAISEALRSAVELHMLASDKDSVVTDPKIERLVGKAEMAAMAAEQRGDWIIASELYARLDALFEDRRYKEDNERLGRRLIMIRLYNPERLWELRNERRVAEGEEPLPPYNPLNDTYEEKLDGVNRAAVQRAIFQAGEDHITRARHEHPRGDYSDLLAGGLDAIRTMLTTTDLQQIFPGMENVDARDDMIRHVDQQLARIKDANIELGRADVRSVMSSLLRQNDNTVRIPDEAILHEFGNGAMAALDDFSGIIWPDELNRFRRSTQGSFVGVGIQIQHDDLFNIKVVTPLEGTPAARAGIRADDLIVAVDGQSTLGFTTDQAVETITGPPGTNVTLTIERPGEDEEAEPERFDVVIKRDRIDLQSVMGWERAGKAEDDWDWFIDDENGIGYIRLTGFNENTTTEMHRAIQQMTNERPLNGLILDLRHNPGGLLDQAVNVANLFIDDGEIVSTTQTTRSASRAEKARPEFARLKGVPVAVLINEGSASASEIVSGALQDYARQGKVRAVVIGQRSFGKGSVQNVWGLPGGQSAMKLTTAYYLLPSHRIIHREPGDTDWGVTPDLEVEMLPDQIVDALTIRRDADILPLDEHGEVILDEERPDPDQLLSEGHDLQLHTALVVLQSQAPSTLAQSNLKPANHN